MLRPCVAFESAMEENDLHILYIANLPPFLLVKIPELIDLVFNIQYYVKNEGQIE